MTSKVAVLKTSPPTVLQDIARVMELGGVSGALSPEADLLIKLNLSWSLYFPASSSQPWQLHGAIRALLDLGFPKERLFPVEHRTVVTDPAKGLVNNAWESVFRHYNIPFTPLTEVEWVRYEFTEPLLKLQVVFPEGIYIPKMYIGKQVLHLPTVKTHGHSTTTGAIKNSFGGLLQEARHYAHKYIHEVLVDLMTMQRELHPGIFALMDGTVCGDGAGPRTMVPRIKNYILASADQVAIDAIAAKMMGFDPMEIPYLRMCAERGYGVADPKDIEIVGEAIEGVNFGFHVKRSLVIWGDQMIRKGPLRPLERLLLHSALWRWAPVASTIYHDWFWYPTVGRKLIRSFMKTDWGALWQAYRKGSVFYDISQRETETRPPVVAE